MAPQLAMGTFRIDQTVYAAAYAMARGNTEVWALRNGVYHKPSYPGAPSTMHVVPIANAPDPVNGEAMCSFLRSIGETTSNFEIRVHAVTPHTCAS